jgi:glycosyltransferase involved in cell wall biosynthesis
MPPRDVLTHPAVWSDATQPRPPARIGLIGPLPPPAGGMAGQTRQLAELLRDAQVQVDLVQVNAPYRPAWVGRVRVLRALCRLIPYLRELWRCAGRVDLMHVMANSGWAWHLHAAPAVWIALLRGTPVVVNYRGGNADDFMRRQAHWVRPTMRRAADVIVPSGFLQAIFERHGVATRVVPNIIDVARFRPTARPRDGLHIVVTRNLEPIYGIGVALEAFARIHEAVPDARLSIAGSGPQRRALEARCAELGLAERVTFTGRLDREQVAALYRSADMMLNPSRVDNMPNSVLEAFASGVPVVSTNVGGIPYFVEDGRTALLVPPQDAEAMARAVLRLVHDPLLAAALKSRALASVLCYTWPNVRLRLFEVYAAAVRGAAPAGGMGTAS